MREVRTALVAEAERIWRLIAESPGAPRWSLAEVRSALERTAGQQDAGCSLVAMDEGALSGVVVVARVDADVAEVEMVAVSTERRRRGLGTALLRAAEAWCGNEGVTEMWLEVREGNVAARALYRGLGWVEGGRRKKYYGAPVEDALLLRLFVGRGGS